MNPAVPHDPEDAIPAGSQKGFIAFCETNLRYEKGFKAWMFLGPYLLGAFVLERIVNSAGHAFPAMLGWWGAFLVYLILFPELWRRLLNLRSTRKADAGQNTSPKI